MNLTGSQIRKLEAMSDAELGMELRKHTHRNPVEEAYYRGVTGIAIRRCLEKLNLLLERTELGFIRLDDEHPDAVRFEAAVRDGSLAKAIAQAAADGKMEPANPDDPGDVAAAAELRRKHIGVKVK